MFNFPRESSTTNPTDNSNFATPTVSRFSKFKTSLGDRTKDTVNESKIEQQLSTPNLTIKRVIGHGAFGK
jgi:hypothetical protein